MKKAAFYQGTLMLVPDEFDSFSSFVKEVQEHPLQVLVTLHEKDCLVPYFIEEYCQVKTVLISHPEQLIEIEVEVLKKEEYDLRLTQKMKELRLSEKSLDEIRRLRNSGIVS